MLLLPHNQKTLEDVERFINEGRYCCVVNPCGSGKTSVMAAFIKTHPKQSFLIITKQRNAAFYYKKSDPVFDKDNVYIVTYTKMLRDVENNQFTRYEANYYLIDEAHYLGADKWQQAFLTLTDMYNPLLIGFTATPQRFADQGTGRTIVHTFFGGNTAGNFTTEELEKAGVFVKPEYVLSLCQMETIIEQKTHQLEQTDLAEGKKQYIRNQLQKILTDWRENNCPEKILHDKLPQYMYKDSCNRILVYTSTFTELQKRKKSLNRQIKKVFPHKTVKSYVYTHHTPEAELHGFLTEDKTYIKILYSVDKIMETIHINDLRIAIMLRPSVSNRIITQQFGRINSIANRQKPLIIDMVDNLNNLKTTHHNIKETPEQRHTGKSGSPIRMPAVTRYLDIFDTIDTTLRDHRTYEYNGFTGSITDLATIYGKNPAELRELLKQYPIDMAMKKAASGTQMVNQAILDGYLPLDNIQTPSPEETEYIRNHIYIFDNFLRYRNIADEDIRQDLYLQYTQIAIQACRKYPEPYKRNQYIANTLHNTYIRILKAIKIRNEILITTDQVPQQRNDNPYQIAEYHSLQKHLAEIIQKLTQREQHVLILRFGLDGNEANSLEHIGQTMNASRERIRQIEAKSLRRLRQPSSRKRIQDFMENP